MWFNPICTLLNKQYSSIHSLFLSLFCVFTHSQPFCVISVPLHYVTSPISLWSICAHKEGVQGCFVCQCWLNPSGNKAVRIIATGSGSQSIRPTACSAGQWGFFASCDAEAWEQRWTMACCGGPSETADKTAGGKSSLKTHIMNR